MLPTRRHYHYVQLKTEGAEYKEKYLKWWLQSFLIGGKEILRGVTTDSGRRWVKDLERYSVEELPRKIGSLEREEDENWDLQDCIDYLKFFLDKVKNDVKEELVPRVYVREPGKNEFILDLEKHDDKQFAFLPLWFTAKRAKSDQ